MQAHTPVESGALPAQYIHALNRNSAAPYTELKRANLAKARKEVEMKAKTLFLVVATSLCLWFSVLAAAAPGGGVERTVVTGWDDWPGVPPISEGTLKCPGGEIEMIDPVTPYCAATGRIHFRDVILWSCVTADDPRASGVLKFTINGNLDSDYTGPVWGKWSLVPSPVCDPVKLVEPQSFWEGSWQGQRFYRCDVEGCRWIGDLELRGKGRGGDIDGLHMKGTEIVTTYTPLPVPWEFIPGFPVTGPEGVLEATIKD